MSPKKQTTTDSALTGLTDRQAIRELVTAYFNYANSLRFDDVAALFAQDAIGTYRGDKCIGVPAIIDKVSGLKKRKSSMHVMGTHSATIDGASATAETVVFEYLRADDDTGKEVDMISCLRYNDRLVKQDGRWFIKERTVSPHWARLEPVTR